MQHNSFFWSYYIYHIFYEEVVVQYLCTAASLLCSVFLRLIEELLGLLGQPLLLSLLLLQGRLGFLTLVDLHSCKPQTQQECLQGQDVQEDGDVVQSLETDR